MQLIETTKCMEFGDENDSEHGNDDYSSSVQRPDEEDSASDDGDSVASDMVAMEGETVVSDNHSQYGHPAVERQQLNTLSTIREVVAGNVTVQNPHSLKRPLLDMIRTQYEDCEALKVALQCLAILMQNDNVFARALSQSSEAPPLVYQVLQTAKSRAPADIKQLSAYICVEMVDRRLVNQEKVR